MRFIIDRWHLIDYDVEIIKGSVCSWDCKVDWGQLEVGERGINELGEVLFGDLCRRNVTISKIIKSKNEIALIIIAVPNNVNGSLSPLYMKHEPRRSHVSWDQNKHWLSIIIPNKIGAGIWARIFIIQFSKPKPNDWSSCWTDRKIIINCGVAINVWKNVTINNINKNKNVSVKHIFWHEPKRACSPFGKHVQFE